MHSISVLIPVYNSAPTLKILLERLTAVLPQITRDYEIILIDDGSIDQSWQVIQELVAGDVHMHGLRHTRNYGQHNALLCGIREARCEIIVTLDDDLQNPPEEIPLLIRQLEKGYDVVYGTPMTEQHGFLRNISSRLIKFALHKSMGIDSARYVSAFRAFRTDLRKAFADYNSSCVVIDVLLSWATVSFSHVPVDHRKREQGKSNYTLAQLFTHAVNIISGFSILPLQLASYLGFVFMTLGFGLLIYIVVLYFLRGSSVPGFPFIVSVIAIFAGVQLFVLGIMGEYLARIHLKNMGRPYNAVRTRIGFDR